MGITLSVPLISRVQALAELRASQEFSDVLSSGLYLFVDSCLCLNRPEYIQWNDRGMPELTEYARNHQGECCLTFRQFIPDSYLQSINHPPTFSYVTSAPLRDLPAPRFFCDELKQKMHIEQCTKEISEIKDVLNDLPQTFDKALDQLMQWREVNDEDLASSVDLSSKTVHRLHTKADYNTTTETIVQLCIGLQLPYKISEHLLKAAGRCLRDVEPDVVYDYLLRTHYAYSLDVCNEILESFGIPKLGRKKKE